MADDLDTQHSISEPERYESAAGWQPREEIEFRKLLADHRKNNPEEFCRESMLTAKPARHWQQDRDNRDTPKAELFGPMWRTGELALLFGDTGSGKSILAVQIAESIARGILIEPFRNPHSAIRNRDVLYLDLDHSDEQFDERYSCSSPLLGKPPVRYRFSPKLRRAGFGDIVIPGIFNGDFARYFRHSLDVTLGSEDANIIIVDNLTWLDPTARSSSAYIRLLRMLKLQCARTGTSILVLANSKPRRTSRVITPERLNAFRGIELDDIACGRQIGEIADSVFAIGRSTFLPDVRYVKLLKSSNSPPGSSLGVSSPHVSKGAAQVLNYTIERTTGFVRSRSLALPDPRSAIQDPRSEMALPFLGLTYAGTSLESDHYRDFAAEFEKAKLTEEKSKLKALAKRNNVVDMFLDKDYWRYLKGE